MRYPKASLFSRLWSSLVPLFMVLALVGFFANGAMAGDKKQPKNRYVIRKIGIESFDSVFKRVGELNDLVGTAETNLNAARKNLNIALGLKNKGTWTDALAELETEAQGKVHVVTTGRMPKLEATDVIPSNVQAGIEGLNVAIDSYAISIDALASIPEEAKGLIAETKGFPAAFWKDVGNLNIFELGKSFKKVKKIKNNIEVTLSLPGRTADVVTAMNENVTLISSTFGATWPPGFVSGDGDNDDDDKPAKHKDGKKKGKKGKKKKK